MSNTSYEAAVAAIIAADPRYTREAYLFAQESLDHAIVLRDRERETPETPPEVEHIDGRQLCEAFRDLSLERFGMLAPDVLGNWGLHCTRDLGNVVFNLIAAGVMKANENDRVEDFDDHYDFEHAFDLDVDLIP